MTTVRLDRLTKTYPGGAEPAVDRVSLEVAEGEFMVLLGPSGCGKSTTLRMIAGLESISSGTLEIDGRVVNQVPAKDRDIAMVFQSYALYPHMTVRENLAFGLRRRGFAKGEIARRVDEVAGVLGLEPYLGRKPHALSGGQRQRVALGRAIVRDPKVFLFDEPLSNLDAALRVSTRGELIKLHQRLRATMIYVTHDQVEAMTMGDRICIMDRGRVVQIGKPMEVYRDPANTFVAAFLGSPPMNLIPAEAEEGAVRLGPQRLAVAPPAGAAGRGLVFGFRPEDAHLVHEAPAGVATVRLAARATAVEPLGAETILVAEVAGTGREVMARLSPDTACRPGEQVELAVELRGVRFFDAETTEALGRAATGESENRRVSNV